MVGTISVGASSNANTIMKLPLNNKQKKNFAPVALSIFTQYLQVTRGIQTDYMLEPAGSHGVWGLDDYHCLPFYFGACQLVNDLNDDDDANCELPSSIHDKQLLESQASKKMYFGCIQYIKSLKKGVPFGESSPMLNDISYLKSWEQVSKGLMKLYEGEVLNKLPVVQHFVFGDFFPANWTASQEPKNAPKQTFVQPPTGIGDEMCMAPWAMHTGNPPPPPPPPNRPPQRRSRP